MRVRFYILSVLAPLALLTGCAPYRPAPPTGGDLARDWSGWFSWQSRVRIQLSDNGTGGVGIYHGPGDHDGFIDLYRIDSWGLTGDYGYQIEMNLIHAVKTNETARIRGQARPHLLTIIMETEGAENNWRAEGSLIPSRVSEDSAKELKHTLDEFMRVNESQESEQGVSPNGGGAASERNETTDSPPSVI